MKGFSYYGSVECAAVISFHDVVTLILSIILPAILAFALWSKHQSRDESRPRPTHPLTITHDTRSLVPHGVLRDVMKHLAQWLNKAVEKAAVDWLSALIISIVSQLFSILLSLVLFPVQILLFIIVFAVTYLVLHLSGSACSATMTLRVLCGLFIFFVALFGAANYEPTPTPTATPTATSTATPTATPTISANLKPPLDFYPSDKAYCIAARNATNISLNYPPPGVTPSLLNPYVVGTPSFIVLGRVPSGTSVGQKNIANWLLIRIQAQYLSFSDSRPNDTDLCLLLVNPVSTTIGYQLNTPMPKVIILPY